MMTKRLLAALFVASLSGCTWIYDGKPVVAKYDPPPEYKFKSITHWGIVADDVATQVAYSLNPPVQQDQSANASSNAVPFNDSGRKTFNRPIYVNVTSSSKFGKVFASQLKSSLLSKGMLVSNTPRGALPINFNVETVTHGPIENDGYIPGTLTVLTGGVLAITNAARYPSTGSVVATSLGTAGFIDLLAAWKELNRRPHTEIAVTISAISGGSYLIHTTNTYYIDTVDSDLYNGFYGAELSDGQRSDNTKNYHLIGGGSR